MATKQDLTHELVRIYTFPDGEAFRIEKPSSLLVYMDSHGTETHEIKDVNGGLHIIKAGWRTMRSTHRSLTV